MTCYVAECDRNCSSLTGHNGHVACSTPPFQLNHPTPSLIAFSPLAQTMFSSACPATSWQLWLPSWFRASSLVVQTMTMTMTHSEKSHIRRMKAWPHRQECRGHDPTKKESVLLMKLAHWQGVQVQTVKDRVQCIET